MFHCESTLREINDPAHYASNVKCRSLHRAGNGRDSKASKLVMKIPFNK